MRRRRERLGRAALFVAGALATSACGPNSSDVQDPSGQPMMDDDDPGMADIYGGPPPPDEEPLTEDSEEADDPASTATGDGVP